MRFAVPKRQPAVSRAVPVSAVPAAGGTASAAMPVADFTEADSRRSDLEPVAASGSEISRLRVALSDKYPQADAAELLHRLQAVLARVPARVRSQPGGRVQGWIETNPATVAWLEEVVRQLWPSRRSQN